MKPETCKRILDLIEAGTILVYDREKTICDILRFRNAIGIDISNCRGSGPTWIA